MGDECCNNGTCACNINPIVEPERPTCGIAGCTGGHYPQDHNELAALRAELAELRRWVERAIRDGGIDHHFVDAYRAAQREANDA